MQRQNATAVSRYGLPDGFVTVMGFMRIALSQCDFFEIMHRHGAKTGIFAI
jgi:hypothetical protein